MIINNLLIFKFISNTLSKKLNFGTCVKSGRNFSGRICVHHRGGGNKKKSVSVDFKRRIDQFGYIYTVIYDSWRSSFVGLIVYENGFFSYITLTSSISLGDKIFSGDKLALSKSNGDSVKLSFITLFSILSNIELKPFSGASLARAAGVGAVLTSFVKNKVWLKLNSGWNVCVSNDCIATIGYVSNISNKVDNIGKAGRNRWFGKRPVVRGVAMNPCDHPHGGGEGKKSPLAAPKSPWGKLTKGSPSKKKKNFKKIKGLFKNIN